MLNPSYPVTRLASVLEDVNCRVTLTSRETKHLFEKMDRPVISIDGMLIQKLPPCETEVIRAFGVKPVTPAYILWTSGSTGKPKGIIVQHDCLCTVAENGEPIGFGGVGSRNLQYANYTFDVSVGEIFITILRGGTVCIITEFDQVNNLSTVINDMKITWMFLTPTVAALLDPKEVPNLRTLTLGGEANSQGLVDKWVPHLKLINSYGPAECEYSIFLALCLSL